MKITFILPHAGLAGGIRVVAIYAKHLRIRGHAVTVISLPKPPLTLKQRIKHLLNKKEWPVQKREPSYFDDVNVEHKVLEKVRPITNNDVPDADVIVATWWETAEWVNALSALKGKKFYFIQGFEAGLGPHLPIDRVKTTYTLPLHKIAISQWLVDIMCNDYGDNDVSLVPNSVDSVFFDAPERSKQLIPTVGFLYSTSEFKGYDVIREALNRVRSKFPQLRIVSFGACVPTSSLPLPANTEFQYRPSQEKIREIYSSCDYWLFGSRSEGFGLPLLEAMACRTPVIATPAGAAPELVKRGGGFLIDGYDATALTQAILMALVLPDVQWVRLSRKARATATSSSWKETALLFEKALLSSPKSS